VNLPDLLPWIFRLLGQEHNYTDYYSRYSAVLHPFEYFDPQSGLKTWSVVPFGEFLKLVVDLHAQCRATQKEVKRTTQKNTQSILMTHDSFSLSRQLTQLHIRIRYYRPISIPIAETVLFLFFSPHLSLALSRLSYGYISNEDIEDHTQHLPKQQRTEQYFHCKK
jgi:hypothetical protein